MSERRELWAKEKVYEIYNDFQDILYEAESGKCSWSEALQQIVVKFDGKMLEQPDDYVCGKCGSGNVDEEESVKDPDDIDLVCEDCEHWEKVGKNKPQTFRKN